MEKYDLKNCCETRQTWPKSLTMRSVIFVDGKNRESARFLQKHNITSFRPVIVKVYIPNDKYLIIFADINKREIDQFADAMHDLDISMPILGYADYEKTCEEFFDKVRSL